MSDDVVDFLASLPSVPITAEEQAELDSFHRWAARHNKFGKFEPKGRYDIMATSAADRIERELHWLKINPSKKHQRQQQEEYRSQLADTRDPIKFLVLTPDNTTILEDLVFAPAGTTIPTTGANIGYKDKVRKIRDVEIVRWNLGPGINEPSLYVRVLTD